MLYKEKDQLTPGVTKKPRISLRRAQWSRFTKYLKLQLHWTIYDLALAGLFVALWVVSALPIFNINFGFMRVGFTYVWPILLGLTIKWPLAFITAIIGDNLALLASGTGFSQWMIEYAIIYPLIVLLTAATKLVIKVRSERIWMMLIFIVNFSGFAVMIAILAIYRNFARITSSADSSFDITTQTAQIVIYTTLALMVAILVIFTALYLVSRAGIKTNLNALVVRKYLSFYTIILFIIIIFIWLWGPIAQIRYLNAWVSSATDYYARYELYLIPRILKTPFSLTLYSVIIMPLYVAHEAIESRLSARYRW